MITKTLKVFMAGTAIFFMLIVPIAWLAVLLTVAYFIVDAMVGAKQLIQPPPTEKKQTPEEWRAENELEHLSFL